MSDWEIGGIGSCGSGELNYLENGGYVAHSKIVGTFFYEIRYFMYIKPPVYYYDLHSLKISQ